MKSLLRNLMHRLLICGLVALLIHAVAAGVQGQDHETFDLKNHIDSRLEALNRDSTDIGPVYCSIGETSLKAVTDRGWVETFWAELYRDNQIRQVLLSVEEIGCSWPSSEVVTVFQSDDHYRIAMWSDNPGHFAAPWEGKTSHVFEGMGSPIYYIEIDEDKISGFLKTIDSLYNPLEMTSFINKSLASSAPRLSIVSFDYSSQENLVWIFNTKLSFRVSIDNLECFLHRLVMPAMYDSCDSLLDYEWFVPANYTNDTLYDLEED